MKRTIALFALVTLCLLCAAVQLPVARAEAPGDAIERILQTTGVFHTDDLINVTHAELTAGDETQRLRVHFEDDVYYGGSEGYVEPWLTASGALSDAYADLDGDSAEEYLLLRLDSELVAEYDYSYSVNTWTMSVYEPEGEELVLSCAFPVSVAWWGERRLTLLQTERGLRLAATDISWWDGGGAGITMTLYAYDGHEAYIDCILNAAIGEPCYMIYGPFDPADEETIIAALYDPEYYKADIERIGLVEGENLIFAEAGYGEYISPFLWDEETEESHLDPEAFRGFDEIAERAAAEGLHIRYTIEDDPWEAYSLEILDEGVTLLWANEGMDDVESYIDILVHYVHQPLIDA